MSIIKRLSGAANQQPMDGSLFARGHAMDRHYYFVRVVDRGGVGGLRGLSAGGGDCSRSIKCKGLISSTRRSAH